MLAHAQTAGLRWTLLRTVMVGGHAGATDRMCLDVARSEYLGVTRRVLRDELAYLETRKLVEIARSEVEAWRVTPTRHGRDLVDYTTECEPGIARPPRLAADD